MPKERLGKFDQHYMEIEGQTVDGFPAYAAATYNVGNLSPESRVDCLIASGSYNYAIQTGMQESNGAKGLYLICDIYAKPASGTFQLFVDARNPCDGEYFAVFQTGIIPATGTVVGVRSWIMYPGAVDTGSLLTGVNQLPIPVQWRLRNNVGGGSGSWTYSAGIQYLDS